MGKFLLIVFVAFMQISAVGAVDASIEFTIESDTIYRGENLEKVSLADVVSSIEPGTVVIVSELHGQLAHHKNQRSVINSLGESGQKVSVGMEFINYRQQNYLNDYLLGRMDENSFLDAIQWPATPYSNYKDQILAPLKWGGFTYGLNSPRWLSAKIAQNGLDGLSESDREILPPNFETGSEKYFQRFKDIMGTHVDPAKLKNYFTAQSLWDDTSAWVIANEMSKNPDQVMVVIFGDFHNAYGGGLPDRLKARGFNKVISISQIDLVGLTKEEQKKEVAPHPKYGVRANFVWTSTREKSDTKLYSGLGIEFLFPEILPMK